MARRRVFGALGMLLVGVTAATIMSGSRSSRPSVTGSHSEADVRAVVDDFFAAAMISDWDAAARLLATDFVMFTDGPTVFDKPSYVRILKADDLRLQRMRLTDIRITVSPDQSMASVTYRGVFRTISGGRVGGAETAETLILRRLREGWKITRAHASVRNLSSAPAGL